MARHVSLASLALLAACSEAPQEAHDGLCATAVWAQPRRSGEELGVRGSWDDWQTVLDMRDFDGRWQVAELSVPPGEYGYQIVEAAEGRIDDNQRLTRFRPSDGQEVSLLRVADCAAPQVQTALAAEVPEGAAIDVTVVPAYDDAEIDAAAVRIDGEAAVATPTSESEVLRVTLPDLPRGKHTLELEIEDEAGRESSRLISAWVDPRAATFADQIIYQVMVDRFRGSDGVSLSDPATPGARAGGTLDGITAELRSGALDALAVTTLWLGPVYLNPTEPRAGTDGQMYEGYHGYWPVDSRGVDPRLGGADALTELVEEAHARGIRVLLDIVPNHVYETNPRLAEYQAIGGIHAADPLCICGADDCPWSDFIRTCWFVPYLPDLRFEAPGVLELAVEDALWWQRAFDLDGFRIDAVPMMPRAVTRRISAAVREEAGDPSQVFMLGEIFTGPGTAGTESLRYYLGPDALDSAFDFPLMWTLRSALASEDSGFEAVEASLAHTAEATAGSGAVMALMIGNHDVTRFLSEVVGDAGNDPWGDELPVQSEDAADYERQAIALGLVFTLPGAPVLYYGDEVGLAGGRDPDSRRVMPPDDELTPPQTRLRDGVRRLAQLRSCLPSLRRGERVPLLASANTFAFMRETGDDGPALVVAQRGGTSGATFAPGILYPGAYKDVVSGEVLVLDDGGNVPMEPWSLRVLIPAAHACAQPG